MYLEYNAIRELHLEFTSLCNARCPMCSRTDNPVLPLESISLSDVKEWFPVEFLKTLQHMYSCGNYGDPIVHPECLEICRYFRDNGCAVSLHTNGGVRDHAFWKELADIGVRVVFAIDGLEDTNHIYRVGVDWKRLMSNVKTFIGNGGRATAAFILFEHNEHQEDDIRALCEELGFVKFNVKRSSRFVSKKDPVKDKIKIQNKNNVVIKQTTKKLSKKTSYEKQVETAIKTHGTWDKYISNTEINCKTQKDRSIYVDFQGRVWPCCWLGVVHKESKDDTLKVYDLFGHNMNSLRHNTLYDIVTGEWLGKELANSWEDSNTRLKRCAVVCGTTNPTNR